MTKPVHLVDRYIDGEPYRVHPRVLAHFKLLHDLNSRFASKLAEREPRRSVGWGG